MANLKMTVVDPTHLRIDVSPDVDDVLDFLKSVYDVPFMQCEEFKENGLNVYILEMPESRVNELWELNKKALMQVMIKEIKNPLGNQNN